MSYTFFVKPSIDTKILFMNVKYSPCGLCDSASDDAWAWNDSGLD